jgi:hypothetical protein
MIISDRGDMLRQGLVSWDDAVVCLVACYFLLNLAYPRTFALVSTLLEEYVLEQPVQNKCKCFSTDGQLFKYDFIVCNSLFNNYP